MSIRADQKRQRPEHVRRDPRPRAALGDLLAALAHVAVLERARNRHGSHAAIERDAAAEVTRLNERDRQAARGRVVRGKQPVNAPAHDERLNGRRRRFGGSRVIVWNHPIVVGDDSDERPRACVLGHPHPRPRHQSRRAGTPKFFADLDAYHFEKLHHLLRLIDFNAWADRDVLDVGCGAGVEVVRWARAGARVTGVDIAPSAIALATANLQQQGLTARLEVADGEALPFPDNSFDFVYAHGVVQYTANDHVMVAECRRVLRPGRARDVPVLQPHVMAAGAVDGDENAARARRRALRAALQGGRRPGQRLLRGFGVGRSRRPNGSR